jgi:integrase
MVALSEEHEEILLQVAREYQAETLQAESDYFAMIFVDVNTGLRQGELLGLKWTDLDLDTDEPVATIQRSLQRQVGRGLVLKEPKTKTSRRTIPLMSFVADFLKRLRVRQAAQKLRTGPAYQDNGLVFAQANGAPVEPTALRQVFRRIVGRTAARVEEMRSAGIEIAPFPVDLRFHDLRHTWATRAIGSGMDIKLVSEILGHSTIYITLSTYHHVLPRAKRSAIAELEANKSYAKKFTL